MAVVRTGKRLSRLSALSQIALLNTMGGFLAALCFFLMLPTSATPGARGRGRIEPAPALAHPLPALPRRGPHSRRHASGLLHQHLGGLQEATEGANGVYYQNLSGLEIDYNTLLENLPSLGAPAEGPRS